MIVSVRISTIVHPSVRTSSLLHLLRLLWNTLEYSGIPLWTPLLQNLGQRNLEGAQHISWSQVPSVNSGSLDQLCVVFCHLTIIPGIFKLFHRYSKMEMFRIYKLFPAYSVPEKWSEYLKISNTSLAQNRLHFLRRLFFWGAKIVGASPRMRTTWHEQRDIRNTHDVMPTSPASYRACHITGITLCTCREMPQKF